MSFNQILEAIKYTVDSMEQDYMETQEGLNHIIYVCAHLSRMNKVERMVKHETK